MSRFANFIKSLSDPVTDTAGRSRRGRTSGEWRRRRNRYNSDISQKRGDINRKAEVTGALHQAAEQSGAVPKPYDFQFLRDLSANAVVQAYIDTLSQDVAAAPWNMTARDEEADISDAKLAESERKIKELPAEGQSFADVLESTTRIMLELGDASWAKHYPEQGGSVAEIVPVDSATVFKVVDDGFVEGYVQGSMSTRSIEVDFGLDEIVWFEWSNRPDRHYGQGPLEKASNEVELVEELAEKERLDLVQGSPPGVVAPAVQDEFGGVPNDTDWDTFVSAMRLDEGERHRVGYSKIPVDFTQLVPNYQELQILERSKYWVTVLGSVFKVNPSYAGFDFENVNRSTDETQQEAYAQRGFRVTLRQLEEAINRQLVWPEFSDDLRFEFEREQTVQEKKQRAELIETQARAGKEMENAGRPVTFREGRLDVEDGQMDEGDVGGGGGDGGFFGSVDASAADLQKLHDGDGVRLTSPGDGPAHDDMTSWYSWLEDVVNAGGRIVDASGFEQRVFPPDDPDPNNPRLIVYGLSESDVLALLDRYPAVNLSLVTDASGKKELTKADLERLDAHILSAHKSQIQPEDVDTIEKRAWSGDESVPEFVFNAIKDAIDSGVVFDEFESISGRKRGQVEDILRDTLTDERGWSLDGIVDRMGDVFPGADTDDLETVARTETATVLNEAREQGYRDVDDDDAKFKWQGPSDSRTTDACEELKDETNPNHGGTPVSLPELVNKERAVHEAHFPDLTFRKHVIHPNERHTFVKDTAASTGVDLSEVEVPGADEFSQDDAGAPAPDGS